MKKFGAQYCVYEDSGFLVESVRRVYPLMDRIVFLVGLEPWKGEGSRALPAETLKLIAGLPDPDRKFVVISRYWATEAEQRNDGLSTLHALGCDWCLIVDDDEMFNRIDLYKAKDMISREQPSTAFLLPQVIYWKSRDTAIENLTFALPAFASTVPGEIFFNEGRCYMVTSGKWTVFPPEVIVCHHLSYVRSEEKMKRKLAAFSHADQTKADWLERVWLNWRPEMENLHPNPKATETFRKAVPAASLVWKLEPEPESLTFDPRTGPKAIIGRSSLL